jgi:8-oxo-dGTP pyrophosphatase MutT (NUDIX family)
MRFRFDEEELRERAAARLHRAPAPAAGRSDDDLNPEARIIPADAIPRPAAVLVPLVARDGGLTVLLTQRTDHLARHAGQVAFPGGRIDEGDEGAVEAALRETEEETGLARAFVDPLGFLDTYLTSTSYAVVPVVGLVQPGFTLNPHEGEVADVFEVPLPFLMDPAHHERHFRDWQGKRRYYYAMPWQDRYIWGATAGMIRNLYSLLYASP